MTKPYCVLSFNVPLFVYSIVQLNKSLTKNINFILKKEKKAEKILLIS